MSTEINFIRIRMGIMNTNAEGCSFFRSICGSLEKKHYYFE